MVLRVGLYPGGSLMTDPTPPAPEARIDWDKPIETKPYGFGEQPRPARVVGRTKGAIDYVEVWIEDGPQHGTFNSRYHHPSGKYRAGVTSGFIRGTLCLRNVTDGSEQLDTAAGRDRPFQARVADWMAACFTP